MVQSDFEDELDVKKRSNNETASAKERAMTTEGGYVNPNHQRVKKITEKKNPWIKIAAIAGAIGIVFAGVGAIAMGGLLNQGEGGPGNGGWNFLPGGDDDQNNDDDGHNNNNNNNNHAPDSFVNYMKDLGVEGEGWDDDNYRAAYDMEQANLDFMTQSNFNETMYKMINPLDPEGTLAMAKEVFFPYENDTDIGEKNTLDKINTMMLNFYKDKNYFSDVTQINTCGSFRLIIQSEAGNHPGLVKEYDDWLAQINNSESMILLNGVEVAKSNGQAYVIAVFNCLGAAFTKAVQEKGLLAAESLDAYKDWFAPVQQNTEDNGGTELSWDF